MRVKKRLKRRVKKGIKSVKSAPPEAYVGGASVLVGSAAVVLLATTKSGREILARTSQLVLRSEEEEPESEDSDVQKDAQKTTAKDHDVEDEAEEDTTGDGESEVTDLKPRTQRPPSPREAPASRKATNV
jgi:hypothetical protein